MLENQNGIVLFDGVCNFCDASVNRLIRVDKKKYFRYAPLQSEVGAELMQKFGLNPEEFDSVILIDDNKAYTYSSAVLHMAKKLGGLYPVLFVFIIIPPFIRNGIYKWFAKNRYKWYGKKDSCMVPSPEIRSRFIG